MDTCYGLRWKTCWSLLANGFCRAWKFLALFGFDASLMGCLVIGLLRCYKSEGLWRRWLWQWVFIYYDGAESNVWVASVVVLIWFVGTWPCWCLIGSCLLKWLDLWRVCWSGKKSGIGLVWWMRQVVVMIVAVRLVKLGREDEY